MADLRIPDDKASAVFERAARLYAQESQTYSETELIQAGAEAQIPAEYIQTALQQLETEELQHQRRQQQRNARRKQLQIGAIALGLLLVGWGVWTYNALSAAAQTTDLAWAQVENQFQRRADLIPNLVNVTRAGADQERQLVALLTQARQNYLRADTQSERVEAAEQLTGALNQFQTYVIQNPELRSNQLFVGLQDELAGTENRIAIERKRYNERVALYNRQVRSFPNSLIAGLFGFQPKPLFEAEPRSAKPPQISPTLSP